MGDEKEFSRRDLIKALGATAILASIPNILKSANLEESAKDRAQWLFDYSTEKIEKGSCGTFYYEPTEQYEHYFQTKEFNGIGFKIIPIKQNGFNEMYVLGYSLIQGDNPFSNFYIYDLDVNGVCNAGRVDNKYGLNILLPNEELGFLESKVDFSNFDNTNEDKITAEIFQQFYDNTLYFINDNLKKELISTRKTHKKP